jgi:hypothetical protein
MCLLCSAEAADAAENAIHEFTRNVTKHRLCFELFRVNSWIAFR